VKVKRLILSNTPQIPADAPGELQTHTALEIWLLQSVSCVHAAPINFEDVCAAHAPLMQTFPGAQSPAQLHLDETAPIYHF